MKKLRVSPALLALCAAVMLFVGAFFLGRASALGEARITVQRAAPESDALQIDGSGEGRLCLNTATREELLALPGVGEKTADRILSYRDTYGSYIKYAMRNALDIATNGCSVNVRLSPDKKTFERVRIAYGVAGPIPMRAPTAEAAINGLPVTMENVDKFAETVLQDINPRDSWRASKAFRQHVAVESARRCLIESVKLAGGAL